MEQLTDVERQLVLFVFSETVAQGREWTEKKRWDFAYHIDRSYEDANKLVDGLIQRGYLLCETSRETSGLRYAVNAKHLQDVLVSKLKK